MPHIYGPRPRDRDGPTIFRVCSIWNNMEQIEQIFEPTAESPKAAVRAEVWASGTAWLADATAQPPGQPDALRRSRKHKSKNP